MITTVNMISRGGSTNLAILEAQRPGGRLFGLAKTVAIICNNSKAAGIQLAIDLGFPEKDIHLVSRTRGDLGEQIVEILKKYNPDFYHQLGWMPKTPKVVIERFRGLNQHLGPGGDYMYGERRIYAHLRFCQMIDEKRPIPVFCQFVHSEYDQGDVVYVRFEDFDLTESVQAIAKRLLPVEHEVQIEALVHLASCTYRCIPVPRVYETPEEEKLMDQARLEAENFYRNKYMSGSEVYFVSETHVNPILC